MRNVIFALALMYAPSATLAQSSTSARYDTTFKIIAVFYVFAKECQDSTGNYTDDDITFLRDLMKRISVIAGYDKDRAKVLWDESVESAAQIALQRPPEPRNCAKDKREVEVFVDKIDRSIREIEASPSR